MFARWFNWDPSGCCKGLKALKSQVMSNREQIYSGQLIFNPARSQSNVPVWKHCSTSSCVSFINIHRQMYYSHEKKAKRNTKKKKRKSHLLYLDHRECLSIQHVCTNKQPWVIICYLNLMKFKSTGDIMRLCPFSTVAGLKQNLIKGRARSGSHQPKL